MMDDCLVCRKHRGEIPAPGGFVYEDDLLLVSHSFIPEGETESYLGIYFIEPKRHVPGLADLTPEEAQRTGLLITRLSKALVECLEAEHVYLFVLGHHVPHLHIWIVPRHPGTPREYWGLKVDEWPEAPTGDIREIEELSDRIRDHLTSVP